MKNHFLLAGSLILAVTSPAGATDEVIRVALLSSSAQTALYKWNDGEGRIHYSDKPPIGIARDYDTKATPLKVTVESKSTLEFPPLPIAPRDSTYPSSQKPKPDLTANLVWLDKTAR